MNMLITESAPLLGIVASLLKSYGMIIWSGILVDKRDEAVSLAGKIGLKLIKEKREYEWWCGAFRMIQ